MTDDATLAARGLPETVYVDNVNGRYGGDAPVIAIQRGVHGYYPIYTRATAAVLNDADRVTLAQVDAMLVGSMFGWDVPGAYVQETAQ